MTDKAVTAFNQWYYSHEESTWKATTWLGVPVQKNVADLWIYQELIHAIRPRWIIETGTLYGGSALYLAMIGGFAVSPAPTVITIDHEPREGRPAWPTIEYVLGDSADPAVAEQIAARVASARGPRLVILDSDHAAPHVLQELRLYAPMVTQGSYVIVEDGNLGHEVLPDFGPGPAEAIAQWLPEQHLDFTVDRACERLGLTFNAGGYLRRGER